MGREHCFGADDHVFMRSSSFLGSSSCPGGEMSEPKETNRQSHPSCGPTVPPGLGSNHIEQRFVENMFDRDVQYSRPAFKRYSMGVPGTFMEESNSCSNVPGALSCNPFITSRFADNSRQNNQLTDSRFHFLQSSSAALTTSTSVTSTAGQPLLYGHRPRYPSASYCSMDTNYRLHAENLYPMGGEAGAVHHIRHDGPHFSEFRGRREGDRDFSQVAPPRLSTFDAEPVEKGGISWKAFYEQLEGISALRRWDDATKVEQLLVSLSGKALEFFARLPLEDKCSYRALVRRFEDRFGREELSVVQQFQLHEAHQESGEELEAFAERVMTLAYGAYGATGMAMDAIEAIAVSVMLTGCSGREAAATVMNRSPRTMREALRSLKTALAISSVLDMRHSHGDPQGVRTSSDSPRDKSDQKSDVRVCQVEESDERMKLGKRVSALETEVSEMESLIQKGFSELKSQLLTLRSPADSLQARGKLGRCFECKEEGHFKRDCPKRHAPIVRKISVVDALPNKGKFEMRTQVSDSCSPGDTKQQKKAKVNCENRSSTKTRATEEITPTLSVGKQCCGRPCTLCGAFVRRMSQHVRRCHLPWFWNPDTACWTCRKACGRPTALSFHWRHSCPNPEQGAFTPKWESLWLQLMAKGIDTLLLLLGVDRIEEVFDTLNAESLFPSTIDAVQEGQGPALLRKAMGYEGPSVRKLPKALGKHPELICQWQIALAALQRLGRQEESNLMATGDSVPPGRTLRCNHLKLLRSVAVSSTAGVATGQNHSSMTSGRKAGLGPVQALVASHNSEETHDAKLGYPDSPRERSSFVPQANLSSRPSQLEKEVMTAEFILSQRQSKPWKTPRIIDCATCYPWAASGHLSGVT